MLGGIHLEVLFAAAYAAFLVLTAFILEHLARHSHQRSERFPASGFSYDGERDVWECPGGWELTRVETDPARGVVFYRAPAHACKVCALKPDCTDSDQGRILEYRPDAWLRSEVRRFHRGFSLVLMFLAALILGWEAVHYDATRDLLVLGGLLVPIGSAGAKLLWAFLGH